MMLFLLCFRVLTNAHVLSVTMDQKLVNANSLESAKSARTKRFVDQTPTVSREARPKITTVT